MKTFRILMLAMVCLIFAGCEEFYSCRFTLVPEIVNQEKLVEMLAGFENLAPNYGLSVFINDSSMIVFRKGADGRAPAPQATLDGAAGSEVTLVYDRETQRVFINQRAGVTEKAFAKALRQDVMRLLERLFGKDGYKMQVGKFYKDPLA